MASDLRGYSADEVLNKVLNTSNDSIQVDIVAGAEYAEDSGHTSTDTGNFILGVRNDTLGTLGDESGDYVPFQMNASGALYVEISSGGANDSIYVDDADWTDSTSKHTLVGGLYQSTPQTITDGDTGPLQVNANGNLIVDLSATDNAVLDAMVVDLAALETLQTSTNTKLDTLETTLTAIETDQAALEVLSTAANVDHAANEALLITIDEDTNAIKGHVDGIETLITSTNSKIDTLDAVQDNALTKLGEIETTNNANQVLLGTIDSDTDAIKTAVQILDNAISGSEMQVDVVAALPAGSNNIGDVDVLSVVPGYGATNLGKREDDPHANLDTGVMALAVRNDVLEALSGTDGDYSVLQVNKTGALNVTETVGHLGAHYESSTTANSSLKIVAFQFLEDTKFSVLTPATSAYIGNTGGGGDDVANTEVFPQGMTIFGRWTAFTLVSGGRVIAYLGDW